MRSRLHLLLLAVALLVVLGSGPAFAQSSAPAPANVPPVSLSALIDQARALFPTVDGDVIEVQGTALTVSAGRAAGAVPGLVVEVYREGREIKHPRTGQVLGRAEEAVGRAVVTRVFDGYAQATLQGTGAAVGDRIRTLPGKTRLTILALAGPGVKEPMVEAVVGELYDGLNRTERFSVGLGEQVLPWMRQQGITPEQFLAGRGVADAARVFKIEHLLLVHLTTVERKPFMDVRLYSAERADAALTAAMFVPSSIKPVQPGRFSASDRALRDAPERKPRSLLAKLLGGDLESGKYSAGDSAIPLVEVGRVDFPVVSMDVALGADRVPRVTLTDSDRVFVYRIENRTLVPEWSYTTRAMGRVISVQLADLLSDGTLQVVVNRFDSRMGLTSSVLGVKKGKPVEIAKETNTFLLAVDEKGAGIKQTLWSQPYSHETFFSNGRVEKVAIRDGGFVVEQKVIVPDNFRLTGATMAALQGKDQRLLVYIDERSRLRVAAGPEEVWSSASVVGGSVQKIEVERQTERGGRSFFYQFEPLPLAIDLDGDGVQEVVIPQNQVEGMVVVVFRGPAGLRLQQLNTGFEGLISGLGGFPGEDGGSATLIAAVVRHKNVFKTAGQTQIIMTISE